MSIGSGAGSDWSSLVKVAKRLLAMPGRIGLRNEVAWWAFVASGRPVECPRACLICLATCLESAPVALLWSLLFAIVLNNTVSLCLSHILLIGGQTYDCRAWYLCGREGIWVGTHDDKGEPQSQRDQRPSKRAQKYCF